MKFIERREAELIMQDAGEMHDHFCLFVNDVDGNAIELEILLLDHNDWPHPHWMLLKSTIPGLCGGIDETIHSFRSTQGKGPERVIPEIYLCDTPLEAYQAAMSIAATSSTLQHR